MYSIRVYRYVLNCRNFDMQLVAKQSSLYGEKTSSQSMEELSL